MNTELYHSNNLVIDESSQVYNKNSFSSINKQVSSENPNRKNKNKNIGDAGELYTMKNIRCIRCYIPKPNYKPCKNSEKSKDLICNHCNAKYQIKTKKDYNLNLNIPGGGYDATYESIKNDKINYIIIFYDENMIIKMINYIPYEKINTNCIKKRDKPLKYRPNYYMCNFKFDYFEYLYKRDPYKKDKPIKIIKDMLKKKNRRSYN